METKIRGGASIGPYALFGYHASWPMASLSVSNERLTFSLWPVTYVFDRSSVVGLTIEKILWRRFVRIVHKNPDYAKCVLFRPANVADFEKILADSGWTILPEGQSIDLPATQAYSSRAGIITWVSILAAIAGVLAGYYARK